MFVRTLLILGVTTMASGCGADAADAEQGFEASANDRGSSDCLVVDETNNRLLALPHTTFASPRTARVDTKADGWLTLSSVTKGDVRLEIWFERCLDLRALNGIGFTGSGGDVEFGLASPSNSRSPHGSCVGEYCYPASASGFLESPSSAEFYSWSKFENGSPSAHADPRHVLGVSWATTLSGPSEAALEIHSLSAYSPY